MDWRIDAACRYANNPDAWMVTRSEMSGENKTALRICRTCPVMARCRSWYDSLEPDMRQSVIAGGIRWNSYGHPDERLAPVHLPPGKVTATQAGMALRVSRNTIGVWCADGKLPAERDETGRWVIDTDDLNRFVEASWTS